MDCTDPWMFPLAIRAAPVSFGLRTWHLMRPAGEHGEVPDWDWLAATYAAKGYIPAKQAIERKGR